MHQIQKDLLALSRNVNLGDRSLREIGRLIGVTHPEKIRHHLEQLERRGFLMVDRINNKIININSNKGIERNFINVPIVGSANCGPAEILAEENIEAYLKLSKNASKAKAKKSLFAVRAQGNSMNKANIDGYNIEPGDFVIVDRDKVYPKHGDYVLSVIDGAANIKRYYKDEQNEQVVLLSESTHDYPPIYVHHNDYSDFMINGTVVQVIKQPSFND